VVETTQNHPIPGANQTPDEQIHWLSLHSEFYQWISHVYCWLVQR